MYKTIVIYETQLQKRIINYFIDNGEISNERLLIINAIGHQVKVNKHIIDLNFNKFSKIYTSFRNISKFKEENLVCETLVSTHFTGINALFFSSFIKCKNKLLIDDGIGTPVILLDNQIYKRLIRFQVRFLIIRTILYFFFNTNLLPVKKAVKEINKYYSIYNLEKLFTKTGIDYKYINGFNKEFVLMSRKIGFIGSPMVDFGLVSENKYMHLLSSILSGEGSFTYYLHPDEKRENLLEIKGISFVKPQVSIEEYFEKHGVPETLYTFSSSASINIAAANPDVKIYYIKFKSFFRNKSNVYNRVLNTFSIIESIYTV